MVKILEKAHIPHCNTALGRARYSEREWVSIFNPLLKIQRLLINITQKTDGANPRCLRDQGLDNIPSADYPDQLITLDHGDGMDLFLSHYGGDIFERC